MAWMYHQSLSSYLEQEKGVCLLQYAVCVAEKLVFFLCQLIFKNMFLLSHMGKREKHVSYFLNRNNIQSSFLASRGEGNNQFFFLIENPLFILLLLKESITINISSIMEKKCFFLFFSSILPNLPHIFGCCLLYHTAIKQNGLKNKIIFLQISSWISVTFLVVFFFKKWKIHFFLPPVQQNSPVFWFDDFLSTPDICYSWKMVLFWVGGTVLKIGNTNVLGAVLKTGSISSWGHTSSSMAACRTRPCCIWRPGRIRRLTGAAPGCTYRHRLAGDSWWWTAGAGDRRFAPAPLYPGGAGRGALGVLAVVWVGGASGWARVVLGQMMCEDV